MRSIASLLAVAALSLSILGCGSAPGWTDASQSTPEAYQGLDARTVADRIAHGDASRDAGEALRNQGPTGLRAILAAYDQAVADHAPAEAVERLSRAVDQVARQRDAIHTRAYWYTDLEQAKRAAAAQNKPILSLRMLGRLDDDLSCANSRFFRTTLYPNREVAQRLQNEYVLHWSSERPVPVVTIDYGDGRVVKRTITGNSIHYVLDPQGNVLDAIPGLYGPKGFAQALDQGRAAVFATAGLAEPERVARLAMAHRAGVDRAAVEYAERASAVGYRGSPFPQAAPAPQPAQQPQIAPRPAAVPALVAIPAAMPKAMVEMPIARAIAPDLPPAAPAPVPWKEMSAGLRGEVKLDDAARAVMRSKAPLDWTRGRPLPLDDAGFEKLVDTFETHVAEDMIKNELFFRAQIKKWLAARPDMPLTELNERVYAELFMTPAADPWLGLVPPITYTGIQGDGF